MPDADQHEPDPAALDELQRAFGVESDDADVAPPDESPPGPAVASASEGERDPTPSDESGELAPGDPPEPVPPVGAGEAGDEPAVGEPDADDHRAEPDSAEGFDDVRGSVPDPLAALRNQPVDDTPDVELGDELVIVEQEPLAEPEPEPPSIIRIDDFTGSTTVAPAPADATPATPTDAPSPVDGADDSGGAEPDDEFDAAGDDELVVISVDDDDLPDPVYVEGSLDGSGSRTIVFIDDDDTGDTITPGTDRDARRGIEPRIRERRAAIKRAMGRRRLRWLVGITAVAIVGVAALAVLGSGWFAVQEDRVQVVGAVYTDPERLAAVVDELVGTPTLRVDIEAVEESLEAIPWVDEARVRIQFPNSATIDIRERQAMATYLAPDQRHRVLDRDGRVLDVLAGNPIAYVLIRGPDPVDLEPGEFAPQGYAAAAELAKNLTNSLRGRVEWIEVTADGSSLSLHLDDGTVVRFGAASDLFNKLLRLETTLMNNPDLEPGVIDVSTREVTF